MASIGNEANLRQMARQLGIVSGETKLVSRAFRDEYNDKEEFEIGDPRRMTDAVSTARIDSIDVATANAAWTEALRIFTATDPEPDPDIV